MRTTVLLVDADDRRRRQVAAELQARAVPALERTDAALALDDVEHGELGAVVLADDRRLAVLRELCHRARARHPRVRLVVLAPGAVERRTVEACLGVDVDVLDQDGPPGGIAAHVLALMARAAEVSSPPPAAREPRPDVDAAFGGELPPAGDLDEHTAVALLRSIHERQLTGRLEVVGREKGTLYFHRGEPVAADHPRGDAGLLDELERHGLVPGSLDIGFVPEGELLATLITAGNVSGETMHRFVIGFVRARLVELVLRGSGHYRFARDGRFLERAPLLHVDLAAVLDEWERSRSLPVEEPAPQADEDARAREEVLSLYMRLKPLLHPRQILGVPLWADDEAVRAAYERRLEETDPARLPPGPSRAMLEEKLAELRRKVVHAMETLELQQGKGKAAAPPGVLGDSNPF